MKTRELAYAGVLCGAAAVLGYIESLLPPFVPVAGFKIGISNIAVMYALYKLGRKQAFFVMLAKVLVTCLWFSGLSALIYSLFGGIASFFAMSAAKKLRLSPYGVGICGGVLHNVGQLAAAWLVMGTAAVFLWSPALLAAGVVTGLFVGAVTAMTLRAVK